MERYKSIFLKQYNLEKQMEPPKGISSFRKPLYFIWNEAVIRVDKYIPLIMEKFYNIHNSTINKGLKSEEIVLLFNKEFKTNKINFGLQRFQKDDEEDSGINYGETGIHHNNKSIINIIMYFNPLISKTFYEEYKKVKEKFQILIKHELIHRGQFIKIMNDELRFKVLKNEAEAKEYYERPKEIMAYADSLIEELRFKGHSDSTILDIVKENKKDESNTLDLYIFLFKENKDEKKNKLEVLHKLYKYVYEYLKGIDGKI